MDTCSILIRLSGLLSVAHLDVSTTIISGQMLHVGCIGPPADKLIRIHASLAQTLSKSHPKNI
jgi:hypothetical protein